MTTVSSPPVRRRWRLAAALVVLSAVPVAAGAARVGQLAGGGPVTSDNARFFASPVPVVLHIVGASVYCLLGAFQFAPRRWHRTAGRVLVPCGLVAALAGLWMAAFYPLADDVVLKSMRFTFGTAMAVSLVLGYLAVRLPLTYLLTDPPTAGGLGWGLHGAWVAMLADLCVRGTLIAARFLHGGWTRVRV